MEGYSVQVTKCFFSLFYLGDRFVNNGTEVKIVVLVTLGWHALLWAKSVFELPL